MAGRPQKLNEIKILNGNPGCRKIKPSIKLNDGLLRCPNHLSPTAKAWWKKTVPQLKKLGVLSNIDTAILEYAATAYSLADTAIKAMSDKLPLYKTEDGEIKINNVHIIYRQNAELYIRLCNEIGLSPISRQKIQQTMESGKDYFDSIL